MKNVHSWGPNGMALAAILTGLSILAGGLPAAGDISEVEPGFVALKFAEDLPSYIAFSEAELELAVCHSEAGTVAGKGSAVFDTSWTEPGWAKDDGPVILCTDLEDEDSDQIIYIDGLVFHFGGPVAPGDRIVQMDVRPVELEMEGRRIHSSCGEWQLEVELWSEYTGSGTARFWSQPDGLGGSFVIEVKMVQQLRLVRLSDGVEEQIERISLYSGGGEWSSTAQELGLSSSVAYVDYDGDCACEVGYDLSSITLGMRGQPEPEPRPFCLAEVVQGGQLCLRPFLIGLPSFGPARRAPREPRRRAGFRLVGRRVLATRQRSRAPRVA